MFLSLPADKSVRVMSVAAGKHPGNVPSSPSGKSIRAASVRTGHANPFFVRTIKKAFADSANINCQDQGPAQAGRGWPAGRAGEAPEIMEIAKNI